MKSISCVWLIFTLIFIGLSIFHFIESKRKVAPFQVSKRPLDGVVTIETGGSDIDKPLKDFAKDFNKYLYYYNSSVSRQNLFAGFGYLLAALVAIFSMVLGLISKT